MGSFAYFLGHTLMLMIGVRVVARTGRIGAYSAARLAVVAATVLTQDHATPQVAGQLMQFLGPGHRLIEVSQEISE